MDKEKKFLKNTIILFVGKFATQLVAFLLLPLYTYKLTTSDYGYIDLVQTYISLLAPVLLLQVDSAIFRFLIEDRNNLEKQRETISTSTVFIMAIIIVIAIFTYIMSKLITISFFPLIILNMLAVIINLYFLSIARGLSDSVTYSISSVINCLTAFIINLILILLCGYDARSILIASIIANLCASCFIFIKKKVNRYIDFKLFNKNTLKEILKYSIPMIPNVVSWWIVGLSDRTIISLFISASANGIYSVSCKFSNLINSIFAIFNISWQETASLHIDDDDASDFFSKMIMEIYKLFVVLSCGIIGGLPIAWNIFVGESYIEAYNYIPILVLANICYVIDGLLGGIYVAKKMIKKVAITTTVSAFINIIINLILVKEIGLYAASISTLIAYLAIAIYRYYDVNKFIKIKLRIKNIVIYIIYYIILVIFYYFRLKIISIFVLCIIVLLYLIENKNIIKKYIDKILRKIVNK